ncbi:MAG: hypothetical protein ABIA67_01015 [Candidatus Margulisiibacteriota bacterium]
MSVEIVSQFGNGNSAGTAGGAKDYVQNHYNQFKSELAYLMSSLSDTESDLELGGITIAAEYKFGAAGTYLIETWRSEQESILSSLIDAVKFEQTLDKYINQAATSG